MELQRVLFRQLTGENMSVKEGATVETQLADLQTACVGKCVLVVLDDIWEKEQEAMLSCIDPSTTSKLLVTTRIRGLLQHADELSLNLMAQNEAVDLLLRTGQVKDTSKHTIDAAAKIAELCGFLPLFLSICGGIVLSYEGSSEWKTDLVEMLETDRVSTIDDIAGGSMVERLVDSSLSMLDDEAALAVFMALGVW